MIWESLKLPEKAREGSDRGGWGSGNWGQKPEQEEEEEEERGHPRKVDHPGQRPGRREEETLLIGQQGCRWLRGSCSNQEAN